MNKTKINDLTDELFSYKEVLRETQTNQKALQENNQEKDDEIQVLQTELMQ